MTLARGRRSSRTGTLAFAWALAALAQLGALGAERAARAADAVDTTPPPGVDLTKLDEFERKVFFRVINQEASVCGDAHSLAFSLKNDRACRKSPYAARYIARLVDSGYTDSEISERLARRYRTPPVRSIDVAQAPMKGNPSAPVTIVEFADYECPHCKRVQPVLKALLDEFHNELRVYFKHYPLSQHTNARIAAEAATAAQEQGKFWPYNDKVWDNSEFLTPALLEKIAKDVGLDVGKWRLAVASTQVKARVDKDRTDGGALAITSTPTIYINGKLYGDARDIDSMRDWVAEELGR